MLLQAPARTIASRRRRLMSTNSRMRRRLVAQRVAVVVESYRQRPICGLARIS